MFQKTAFRRGFCVWLLGCVALVYVLLLTSCCPGFVATGNTGNNCTCTKAEEGNVATTHDSHTQLQKSHKHLREGERQESPAGFESKAGEGIAGAGD